MISFIYIYYFSHTVILSDDTFLLCVLFLFDIKWIDSNLMRVIVEHVIFHFLSIFEYHLRDMEGLISEVWDASNRGFHLFISELVHSWPSNGG